VSSKAKKPPPPWADPLVTIIQNQKRRLTPPLFFVVRPAGRTHVRWCGRTAGQPRLLPDFLRGPYEIAGMVEIGEFLGV
jgi:hypothetical protein